MTKERTFTVVDQYRMSKTYKGFNLAFNPVHLEHVAIVLMDGEPELYALEDPKRVSGLVEYLLDVFPNAILVGVYSRK